MLPLKTSVLDSGGLCSQAWNMWFNSLLQRNVFEMTTDLSLDEHYDVVYATSSGFTVTLPDAVINRIGKSWTVNLSCYGDVTVKTSGTDTIMAPTSTTETTILLSVQGSSITLLCTAVGKWIII